MGIFQIINFKTVIISVLACLSTYLCIKYNIKADYPLALVATAVIFPIVFSINGAYKRREKALSDYAVIKSHGRAIYLAAKHWGPDPKPESINKGKTILAEILFSCRDLLSGTVAEAKQNEKKVYEKFADFSSFIRDDIRTAGLAGGEVSRANQYFSKMLNSFESIKNIFYYRTPRTLRTFSTIFITVLPILYGPYFANEATNYSRYVTYVLPTLFTLVLVSLSNIQEHLENPFDGVGEDDINFNVEEFLENL